MRALSSTLSATRKRDSQRYKNPNLSRYDETGISGRAGSLISAKQLAPGMEFNLIGKLRDFGNSIANLKLRKNKSSQPHKVLTAQAEVLRTAHYRGLSTTPLGGYSRTIVLAHINESQALCNKLGSSGWEVRYYADKDTYTSQILSSSIPEEMRNNVEIDHIGCISYLGLCDLSSLGLPTKPHMLPNESGIYPNHYDLVELLPKAEGVNA